MQPSREVQQRHYHWAPNEPCDDDEQDCASRNSTLTTDSIYTVGKKVYLIVTD